MGEEDRWMGGWLCEWMGGYMDTWMVHEWLYGWINGWLFLYFFYKIITWDSLKSRAKSDLKVYLQTYPQSQQGQRATLNRSGFQVLVRRVPYSWHDLPPGGDASPSHDVRMGTYPQRCTCKPQIAGHLPS